MAAPDLVKSFTLLFDRPGESLITPKGEDNSVFLLSEESLPPDYENNGLELNNRFGSETENTIPLEPLARKPQFTYATKLPKDEDFSLFLPAHQEMAREVIDELMSVPMDQLGQLLASCVYCRSQLNSQLFNYCYSVVLAHRRDTRNVPLQNFAELFPAKFMDSKVFQEARESAAVLDSPERTPIIIPRDYTATDLEEEHRLAYFREDIGINLHHYHWHLVYPFTASDRSIVAKDRRGELFFYMHQQIIARYNCERLNNSLKRVKKFGNWREPISEAYFPKLDSLTSARGWPPRQSGMTWQDLDRPVDNLKVTVEEMLNFRKKLEEAVDSGQVVMPDGSRAPLDIDMLGNMLESSILSPNQQYYGSVHNNGHTFSAYMHDPKHRFLESFGVIADEATTMRDPFFYRWHAWIDDFFQSFKQSNFVSRYTPSELDNPGVQIQGVQIENDMGGQNNVLNTYWMQSDVDLSRGLDFSNRGPVYARFTHLNHEPFRYVINVNNTGSARRATVRIFLAPKFDERNLPWQLVDQRKMFIEMDRFVTPLNRGPNVITRRSTESSVTIPFEQTFRDLSVQGDNARDRRLDAFNYCGCGWPQHMLVPRGTEAGATYQLFVMLSNWEQDRVEQPDGTDMTCKEASSFCGLKDKKYPDRRAMGFPFDRPPRSAENIEEFLMPNMAVEDVVIRLNPQVRVNPRNAR